MKLILLLIVAILSIGCKKEVSRERIGEEKLAQWSERCYTFGFCCHWTFEGEYECGLKFFCPGTRQIKGYSQDWMITYDDGSQSYTTERSYGLEGGVIGDCEL